MTNKFLEVLRNNAENFGSVLAFDYNSYSFCILDLTDENKELEKINLADPNEFNGYIKSKISGAGARFAIGKYNEDRTIYSDKKLFTNRTIHLGIDIWTRPEVEVLAPLPGIIHSLANNQAEGDYGPTIILEHYLQGTRFYTLYGHLSPDSLNRVKCGQAVKKGQVIGSVGNYPDNGNWPPHLHFQIIREMGERKGDFPGVASFEDREIFLKMCPDPNLILQIPKL
jgi:peptidoglycan LD-endopeptidase LytH